MKKFFLPLFALTAAVVQAATWTGAANNGLWDDGANWEGGAAPGNNEEATIAIAADTTFTLPAAGAKVGKLWFHGANTLTATFEGGPLTVTGGYGYCLTNSVILDLQVPVTFSQKNPWLRGNSIHFRKPVLVTGTSSSPTDSTWALRPNLATSNNADFQRAYYFYDEVNATNSVVHEMGYPDGFLFFYGPLRTVRLDMGTGTSGNAVLYSSDNDIKDIRTGWDSRTSAMAVNAFSSNCILRANHRNTDRPIGSCVFNLSSFDQTIDRLGLGVQAAAYDFHDFDGYDILSRGILEASGKLVTTSPIYATTLTLRGTADDMSDLAIHDGVSLVWDPVDDFTQVLSNRINKTTGSLTVKRGTLAVVGNATFANVPTITVAAGATFDLDVTAANALAGLKCLNLTGAGACFRVGEQAETPFGTAQFLADIATGATIEVPAGVSVDVAVVHYQGQYPAAGTYTAETAAWVTGGGTVNVTNQKLGNQAIWRNAAGGAWETAANWIGAQVPTGTDEVVIDLPTAEDITITISSALTDRNGPLSLSNAGGGTTTLEIANEVKMLQPKGEVTIGAGGRVKVAEDGVFRYNGGNTPICSITIEPGGEWLTAGGVTAWSNFWKSVEIQGNASATGRLAMTSGVFAYHSRLNEAPLQMKGGQLDFTGGTATLHKDSYASTFVMTDGTARFKDLRTDVGVTRIGTGTVTLEGTATMWGNKATFSIAPNAAGETARLVVKDTAALRNAVFSWCRVGGKPGGFAYYDFDSTCDCADTWRQPVTYQDYPYLVGVGGGYGELNVLRGILRTNIGGFHVGTSGPCGLVSDSNPLPTLVPTEGVVHVKEGTLLYVGGGSDPRWVSTSSGMPLGLTVGSAVAPNDFTAHPVTGRVEVAGTATNDLGVLLIGAGAGRGTWVQLGGQATLERWHDNHTDNRFPPAVVGFLGGQGELIVSNGAVVVGYSTRSGDADCFVGGCPTNAIPTSYMYASYGWPTERHDAVGRLAVAGGSFQVLRGALIVGADGAGTVEMAGSAGVLSTPTLVLSNATSSAVVFTADATGFAPITATKTVITDGASCTVDLSAYAGTKRIFKLFDSSQIEGTFAEEKVTFIAPVGKRKAAQLRQDATGLSLAVLSGMTINLR